MALNLEDEKTKELLEKLENYEKTQ